MKYNMVVSIAVLSVAAFIYCSTLSVTASGIQSADHNPNQVKIIVMNGKTGKVMPKERLLIFLGNTAREVSEEKHRVDLETNLEGIALLTIEDPFYSRMQVWVDGRVLCQQNPNSSSFSIDEAKKNGASTPNTCGDVARNLESSELIVYARPATLREKMRW